MARTRMPLTDMLHRGVVYSLVGLSVYGVVMSVFVHRDTLKRGREIVAEREALGLPITAVKKEERSEELERTLAEQALDVFRKNKSS
ncbi:hypothetical protein GALMADRAFT_247981 [Galerina marginata CBS 339.88]|uniref:Uncharacterized protein n=1 Tax=Galerina marginata (strain CBS 339.88) TaxID=685588 RepID=A0A067SX74_GALM3|nr:hypothetical protein GALMADRAFT_247981 [Galerina marginata CBS 339.88]